MPTRIKPTYDLGPCFLTFDSIKEITQLIEKNFQDSQFSAHEKTWEVYGESRETFLSEISKREMLDSFTVEAVEPDNSKHLELVFNDREAKLTFTADPTYKDFFEHFLIDLKKHIQPAVSRRFFAILLGSISNSKNSIYGSINPFSKILIQKKQPGQFAENIKANLISNLIWLILGILVTLIVQWIFTEFGVDINPFDR